MNFNQQTGRNNQFEDPLSPFASRLNSNRQEDLTKNLSSFRDGLHKKVNEKFKSEGSFDYAISNRESTTKLGLRISNLSSDRSQQSMSVHKDLLNAVRGISTGKERKLATTGDNFSRPSALSQESTKTKVSEPSNLKLGPQLSSSILDKFSKISFNTQNSTVSPKAGGLKVMAFGSSPEKHEDASMLRQ